MIRRLKHNHGDHQAAFDGTRVSEGPGLQLFLLDVRRLRRRRWRLPIPGQQPFEPIYRMRTDAGDDVGQPGFGLDAVEARGANERVEAGCPFTSSIRSAKVPVFPSESCRPDLVFCGIV